MLQNFCVTNDHGYLVITIRSSPHSWHIIGFVTRVTQRIPQVEQELLTLPEQLSSSPVFSLVCVTWSVLCSILQIIVYHFDYFFFWPLYYVFFDLPIRITPLISSIFSYYYFRDIRKITLKLHWFELFMFCLQRYCSQCGLIIIPIKQ